MRNPLEAVAQRLRPRALDNAGYYAGAQSGRLMYDFIMGTLSANDALRGSLRALRNHSRELTTRNAHASRVPQLFSENVIGQHGITYSAAVTTGENEFDDAINAELERCWYQWAESTHVTTDRSLCFAELEALDTEQEVIDGETLIRFIDNFENPFGFALELIDPDQLDHTYDVEPGNGRNAVVMGVELNDWGEPIAYWLWKNHPSERAIGNRVRVEASKISHTFLRRRGRQRRGIPWFAPVLLDFNHHGGWRKNQLIASRAASAKMGFLEPGENSDDWDDDESELQTENGRQVLPSEVNPGAIERLPKGWKFHAHDPAFPSTSFAEFDDAILRSLAIGSRVSFMSMSGNLSGTSYGSGRIGLLAEQAVYRWMQQRRIRRFNQPILERFLTNALLKGALQLPSFDVARYTAATWSPKPQEWLAPKEDLDVRLAERRAGVTSLFDIAAEKGRDLEEQFKKIAREKRLAEKYGITLDLSPASQANQPLVNPQGAPMPNDGSAPGATTPPLTLIGGH